VLINHAGRFYIAKEIGTESEISSGQKELQSDKGQPGASFEAVSSNGLYCFPGHLNTRDSRFA
jgi:hypothetical protein